jgi:3'-phosphoadenosine 5'-phosphosulfate sulfotransferase (PAPS reductase)/FAD synthetase
MSTKRKPAGCRKPKIFTMSDPRILAWFSCGDASAVAAKLAVEKHGDRCEVLYCDTFAYEHPDNMRFFADVERWLGRPIKVLRSLRYADIYDVFRKTKFLRGPNGARCTTELKKNVRKEYQRVDDIHVFGFTADEQHRVTRFKKENPELYAEFPLIEHGITKTECHARIRAAGIELPAMYKLGYHNNNCIGCVKGKKGYWNKIRRDFPDAFDRMAALERELNFALCGVFLDSLPSDAGRYKDEPNIECGVLCTDETLA